MPNLRLSSDVHAFRQFAFATVALALFAAAWHLHGQSRRKPHLAEAECGECHLAGNAVNEVNAAKLLASQERLCGRCHENALKASHPSGFMPPRALPVEYPADWKGDLTCSTCHVPHGVAPGLLRGARRGKQLCLACHDELFFRRMKDQGGSLVASGHLSGGPSRAADLDAFSLQCLGCHDNAADAPAVRVGGSGLVRHGDGGLNHPIGIRYRDAVRSGSFRPEAMLPRQILLPGGKVGCLACHQAYRKDHGKLVMSNQGSRLCLQCHDI